MTILHEKAIFISAFLHEKAKFKEPFLHEKAKFETRILHEKAKFTINRVGYSSRSSAIMPSKISVAVSTVSLETVCLEFSSPLNAVFISLSADKLSLSP